MRISKRGALGFIVVMVLGIAYMFLTVHRLGALQNAITTCQPSFWNQSVSSTVVFDYAYWHPGASAGNLSQLADSVCLNIEPVSAMFPNSTLIYPYP